MSVQPTTVRTLYVGNLYEEELLAAYPASEPYIRGVAQALGVFLGATGGYHVYKAASKRRS